MKTKKLYLLLTAALSSLALQAAPKLQSSTNRLTPESIIKVVFDKDIVSKDAVGKVQPNDILKIEPQLAGNIIWRSTNVAEFQPAKSPLMGTTYTFDITKSTKHKDGSKIDKKAIGKLETDSFYYSRTSKRQSISSTRQPEIYIAFNEKINAADTAPFFIYLNKKGDRVAANVRQALWQDVKSNYLVGTSWQGRFEKMILIRAQQKVPVETLTATSTIKNGLMIKPAIALPVGADWKLHILKGLPSFDKKTSFGADKSIHIGHVKPFTITQTNATLYVNSPRAISISFSHAVKQSVDELKDFISVSPEVPDMKFNLKGSNITITGDFSQSDKYNVSIKKPLDSTYGLALTTYSPNNAITFHNVTPSISLPRESVAQLANGQKKYPIEAVNMKNIRVQIKELTKEQAIRTTLAYRHYSGDGPDHERFKNTHPLPLSLVPGTKIYDKTHTLDNKIDTSANIVLDWNEILPKDRSNRIFFLSVNGESKLVGTSKRKESTKEICQSFIQLTDIGLAWKLNDDKALVYAYSCETGKPLTNIDLTIYGEESSKLSTTKTDENGVATFERKSEYRHLLATNGDDSFVLPFDKSLRTVSLWRFPINYQWKRLPGWNRNVLLFTDRQLYKPGETVNIKGIVRRQLDNQTQISEDKEATLTITDSAGRDLYNQTIKLSEHGSFDHSLKLPEDNVGTHWISLNFKSDKDDKWENTKYQWVANHQTEFNKPFSVQEFRRNAFKVTSSLAKVENGTSTIEASVGAKYYQGTSLSNATVAWYQSTRSQGFYPAKYRDYQFGDHSQYDSDYWSHYYGWYDRDQDSSSKKTDHTNGTAKLDSKGNLKLTLSIPKATFPTPQKITLFSEVTDARDQTLSSETSRTIHPCNHYIGIKRNDSIHREKEEFRTELIAVTQDGAPSTTNLEVTAEVKRVTYNTVKARSADGKITTTNEKEEEVIKTETLTIPAGQSIEYVFTPSQSGQHIITLTSKDDQGREISTAASTYIYGGSVYPWETEEGIKIKLLSEKQSYKPGETARILVMSPIEGTALITVERSGVLRSFITELKASDPVIEVPLGHEDAPNVYISALLMRGAQDSTHEFKEPKLKLGYCTVNVQNTQDRLTVTLDHPSETKPGSEVTITGTINNSTGEGEGNAELTLYAVDNGVLDVIGYKTPRPLDHFNELIALSVDCGTSLGYFLAEVNPDDMYFDNKGFTIGGGGLPENSTNQINLRKNFSPCALWSPKIITKSDGTFSATFTTPDSLTSYRIMAITSSKGNFFGSGTSELIVNKPVSLQPAAPRFANEGDTVTNNILIANNTKYDGKWEVKLSTSSVSKLSGDQPNASQIISLNAGESKKVSFNATFTETGEAKWQWTATPLELVGTSLNQDLKDNLTDGVEARFPVLFPRPILRESTLAKLDNQELNMLEKFSPDMLKGRGHIELDIANSQLLRANGAAKHLLQYPYGCVEQTSSAMMPWIAVKDLKDYITKFEKVSDDEVAKALQRGVDRLLTMQTSDGGLAYWPSGNKSQFWASSYGGYAMILAQKQGAEVPKGSIDLLAGYIKNGLRSQESTNDWDVTSRARALYTLSLMGSPDVAYMNKMYKSRDNLSQASKGFLALAYHTANNKAYSTYTQNLLASDSAKITDKSFMSSRAHSQIHLTALCEIMPDSPLINEYLQRIFAKSNNRGHWGTTWVNSWTIQALASYARNVEQNQRNSDVILTDENGKQTTYKLSKNKPQTTIKIPLHSGMKLTALTNNLAFVKADIFSKPEVAPTGAIGNDGLSITKEYFRVLPTGKKEPLTNTKVGDLVEVKLTITFQEALSYVVIDDPLPAGFETVNEDFESQKSHTSGTADSDWRTSNIELRNDRALFFINNSWSNATHSLTYIARVTAAGEVSIPAAKVEAMYEPKKYALSAASEMKISARPE